MTGKNPKSQKLSRLLENEGVLRPSSGWCEPGKGTTFKGEDLIEELSSMDWMSLFVFGITGKKFAAGEIAILNRIFTLTSYPDARLWNNRAASLATNSGSTPGLAMSAAMSLMEARPYGGLPNLRALDFFIRLGEHAKNGGKTEDFLKTERKGGKKILGYGRPISSVDERLPKLCEYLEEFGLSRGRHVRLARETEELLTAEKPFLMLNFAGLTNAVLADLGFKCRHAQYYNLMKTFAGVPPCAIEWSEKPAGTLFPTRCDGIAYVGRDERRW